MTSEPLADHDRDDQDRVVSRRVQNPTSAEPGDDAVYQAANPTTAAEPPAPTGGAGVGATTETAAEEIAADNDSEPDRSE